MSALVADVYGEGFEQRGVLEIAVDLHQIALVDAGAAGEQAVAVRCSQFFQRRGPAAFGAAGAQEGDRDELRRVAGGAGFGAEAQVKRGSAGRGRGPRTPK